MTHSVSEAPSDPLRVAPRRTVCASLVVVSVFSAFALPATTASAQGQIDVPYVPPPQTFERYRIESGRKTGFCLERRGQPDNPWDVHGMEVDVAPCSDHRDSRQLWYVPHSFRSGAPGRLQSVNSDLVLEAGSTVSTSATVFMAFPDGSVEQDWWRLPGYRIDHGYRFMAASFAGCLDSHWDRAQQYRCDGSLEQDFVFEYVDDIGTRDVKVYGQAGYFEELDSEWVTDVGAMRGRYTLPIAGTWRHQQTVELPARVGSIRTGRDVGVIINYGGSGWRRWVRIVDHANTWELPRNADWGEMTVYDLSIGMPQGVVVHDAPPAGCGLFGCGGPAQTAYYPAQIGWRLVSKPESEDYLPPAMVEIHGADVMVFVVGPSGLWEFYTTNGGAQRTVVLPEHVRGGVLYTARF